MVTNLIENKRFAQKYIRFVAVTTKNYTMLWTDRS